MRPASSSGNASISLNVSTCRSGRTSRCVSAIGAMSRIATNPSARCTWSPSATSRQNRQLSGGDGKDPLLASATARGADEFADLAVEEPRRVVVAVPTAGTVDEDEVGRCRPSTPSADGRARRRAHAAARFAPSSPQAARCPPPPSSVPGRGEYGKAWTLVISALANHVERAHERVLVLAGEADDDVGREVEVARAARASRGTALRSSGDPSREGRRRLRTAAGRGGDATPARLAQRGDELVGRGGSPRSTRGVVARRRESRPLPG